MLWRFFCFIFLGVFVAHEAVRAAQKGLCGISPAVERYEIYNPDRIFGGENSNDEDFPWFVYQIFNWKSGCSGTIIHRRWILTAAHCFGGAKKVKYAAYYGSANIVHMKRALGSKYFIHPNYTSDATYDIALIKLKKPLKFTQFVRPICLDSTVEPEENEILTMVGLGVNFKNFATGNPNATLFEEKILQDSPVQYLKEFSDEKLLSIGGINHAALFGDSGGPLMAIGNHRFVQVGVAMNVEFKEYDNETISAVSSNQYAKISYYCPWIKKVTNNQVKC